MNLNKFTHAESIIHQGKDRLVGIHKPFLYVGSHITYFGFHLEDADLSSINYLHAGKPKVWYFVPTSEHAKLEHLANEFGKSVSTSCNNFIRHKALMIPPTTLRKNGIRFSRVVQHPNEFIVSFSGGYHSGFNCGINGAEAINFAAKKWLDCFPRFQSCHCATKHSRGIRGVVEALRDIHTKEMLKHERTTAYTCDICLKNFTLKRNLYQHMKNSHEARMEKYECIDCKKLFTRKSNLGAHVKKFHGSTRKFKATRVVLTDRKGKSKNLRGWIPKDVTCEMCDLVVRGNYNLKRHIKNKHRK